MQPLPFAQRSSLMSLQTISKSETYGEPLKIATRDIMKNDDIVGAKSEIKGFKYNNKQSFNYSNLDIEGSTARKLYQKVNKEDHNLQTKDIIGAYPQIVSFKSSRHDNPLTPNYILPYVEPRPFTPLKYIQDNKQNNQVKDLTRLQKINLFKQTQKGFIEGSEAKKLFKASSYIGNLKVSDINYPDTFRSTRNTNPLQPRYDIYQDTGLQIGEVEGSTCRQLHPVVVNKSQTNLTTNDIEKCQTNSCYDQFVKQKTRKQYRNINFTNDILGAQSGTLKIGIQSNRCLDPNQPDYKYLGETKLQIGYRENLVQSLIKEISKNYKKTAIF